jgi:RNA polymerase sigma-70 factor (ECF subfamily)
MAPGDPRDLIGRAQAGDEEAFSDLCRLCGNRLLRQATALCGDAAAAEDLVQETLVEAWHSFRRYNGRCQVFTWLCSILIHRHRDSLRRKRPMPFSRLFGSARDEAETFLSNTADPGRAPGAELEHAERAVRLLRSLDKLPAKQRQVVYLRFYAQDSLEGIAAALGCSVGTVKSRLFHGLARLRKMTARTERERE